LDERNGRRHGGDGGLPVIDQRIQREILREFSEVAVTATTGVRGGVEFARAHWRRPSAPPQARNFMGRISPWGHGGLTIHQFAEKKRASCSTRSNPNNPNHRAVASFLDRKKASELMACFPTRRARRIVERLATLGAHAGFVVETLGKMLAEKSARTPLPFNQTGGLQPTATVLKAMHRDASKALIEALEKRNPNWANPFATKCSRSPMWPNWMWPPCRRCCAKSIRARWPPR
jgi:flagellar motor switch protein FliG